MERIKKQITLLAQGFSSDHLFYNTQHKRLQGFEPENLTKLHTTFSYFFQKKITITGKGVKPFDLTPSYLAITWPICVYIYIPDHQKLQEL